MMKRFYAIRFIAPLMMALTLLLIGCEYDVTQPQWYEPAAATETVAISGVDPAEAGAGVNYITIQGTNLSGAVDTLKIRNDDADTTFTYRYNGVYFDAKLADVVAITSTSIKVRRPNLASDGCVIKVVANNAFQVAKRQPYRITKVVQNYGSFLDNVPLSVTAVDKDENLYVVDTNSRNIIKITPAGARSTFATASRVPFGSAFGPDGNLYLAENNRAVDKVDIATGAVTRWTQLPSGKVVKFCDFSGNYFYTGGTKTDLVIVPFNLATTPVSIGIYAAQEILAIKCYNNEVYVAARTGVEPTKIWKHAIAANGSVGSQQLVLDLGSFPDLTTRAIKALAFSAQGTMLIATDAVDPVLSYNPATREIDYFYKGILNPYCKHFSWGNQNHLYMICGDTATGEDWLVYQVDMGTTAGK